MAYVKNNWVDREGITRYFETVDSDGAKIFTPDYTQVTELGTPVNADNMNHIEEGIEAGSFTKFNLATTYAKDDLVTNITGNELKVYKSLKDENTNNNILDILYWEEVELGGVGPETLDQFVVKDSLVEVQTVIETYQNGTSWYRVWSDGWCEQGGQYSVTSASPHTINLLKSMVNTQYSILISAGMSGVGDTSVQAHIRTDNITTTSFKIQKQWSSSNGTYFWQASGYIW